MKASRVKPVKLIKVEPVAKESSTVHGNSDHNTPMDVESIVSRDGNEKVTEEGEIRHRTSVAQSWFEAASRIIFQHALVFVFVWPAVCLVFGIVGFSRLKVEDNVNSLWTITSGQHYKDSAYRDNVCKGVGVSNLLSISKPRKGGNVLSSEYLTEIAARLQETQEVTVTHRGVTFTFDDVCVNLVAPYTYPCYRYNSLDCFKEGDYDWDSTANAAWSSSLVAAGYAAYFATSVTTVLASTVCAPDCLESGTTLKTDFATDASCSACTEAYLATDAATQVDQNAYAGLRSTLITAGVDSTKLSTINGVIAARTGDNATGGDAGCRNPHGSRQRACDVSSAGYLTDATCVSCYNGVYTNMSDAQKDAAYYPAVTAAALAAGLCTTCRDGDGDTYVKDASADTVNAYPEATLESIGLASGIASFEQQYTYVGIATRQGTGTAGDGGCVNTGGVADGSVAAACTYDADLTFLADSTCQACFGAVYAQMTDSQKETTYEAAMTAANPSLTTSALIDAYATAYVRSATFAVASNTLVASGMCTSTSGDANYGPCDTTTTTWSSDATCMACVNAYLNGDVTTQSQYLGYAGLRQSFTDVAIATTKETTIYSTLAGTTCSAACPTWSSAVPYSASVNIAGSWANDTTCSTCFLATYSALSDAVKDATYYSTMIAVLTTLGQCNDGCRDGDVDTYVKTQASPVVNGYSNAQVDALLEGLVEDVIEGKTPYTYQISKGGASRFVATGASETDILAAASETCYTWDEGQAYPAVNKPVTLGGTEPNAATVSSSTPLEKVKALQVVFQMLHPTDIVKRVALSNRPGGALTLSVNDAKEVLYKMKEAFEEEFTDGWDNDDDGEVEFSAFSDDTGVLGSFGRTLQGLTTQSTAYSLYSYLTVVLLSAIFLGSFKNPLRSQSSLGFVGAILVIIAFFGAVGLTLLAGNKLNVVTTWTLPFLMVGIGVDDMFILALAARNAVSKRGGRADKDAFVEAFVDVTIPITLTSLVNAAMFCVMLISDIPAVYLTAETALASILFMYLTIVTAFSAAVALDFKRQSADVVDLPFCLARQKEDKLQQADIPENSRSEDNPLFAHFYKPLVKSPFGQAFIVAASAALIITGGVGLNSTELGLGLSDFFPAGSQGANFAANQDKYFPVWPATMNWGEVKYYESDVQMEMLQQFESVTGNKRVTDLSSSFVWTANMAEWAMPEAYNLGPCSSSNALTNGLCGPKLDATCTATWVPNTLNLNLKADGGVCQSGASLVAVDSSLDASLSYCPVLPLPEADYANCIKLLASNTNLFASISPGINMASDGVTPELPIKYSRASGSSLYIYDLFDTDAYVEAITETRKGCDDDRKKGPRCWMEGLVYDYWEQYLTIEDWVLELCGIVVAISFATAVGFFWINFGAVEPALVGGLVIALTSCATLLTVTGLASLSNVNLCGISAMSCIMSAGFTVEYSVHVVHRFMVSDGGVNHDPLERALETMDGLFLPTSMAFLTSAVGILFLTLSEFTFVHVYFFTPLITALMVTYFFGCFTVPVVLSRAGGAAFFRIDRSRSLQKVRPEPAAFEALN